MANRERYDGVNNNPGTVISVEAYQVTETIKIVFQNLLESFFNDLSTGFKKRDLALRRFTIKNQFVSKPVPDGGIEKKPIHIFREFPSTLRKYPFCLVSVPEKKENKMYLGWDNIITHQGHVIDEHVISELVTGQFWDITVKIGIASLSVKGRDFLVDALTQGFQGHFRSNYMWQHPDTLSYIFLSLGSKEIGSVYDSSPVTDNEQNVVITGEISISLFVEYYFRDIRKQEQFKYKITKSEVTPPQGFDLFLP